MTRKDYILIAEAIERATRLAPWTDLGKEQARKFAERQIAFNLAYALGQDNPRFDRAQFFKTCNIAE